MPSVASYPTHSPFNSTVELKSLNDTASVGNPFSSTYSAAACFIVRIFCISSASRLFSTAFWYCGTATAAKIPMISTTTNNSMSVKPRRVCFFVILFSLIICLENKPTTNGCTTGAFQNPHSKTAVAYHNVINVRYKTMGFEGPSFCT